MHGSRWHGQVVPQQASAGHSQAARELLLQRLRTLCRHPGAVNAQQRLPRTPAPHLSTSGTGGATWSMGSLSTTSSGSRCASMVSPPCTTDSSARARAGARPRRHRAGRWIERRRPGASAPRVGRLLATCKAGERHGTGADLPWGRRGRASWPSARPAPSPAGRGRQQRGWAPGQRGRACGGGVRPRAQAPSLPRPGPTTQPCAAPMHPFPSRPVKEGAACLDQLALKIVCH